MSTGQEIQNLEEIIAPPSQIRYTWEQEKNKSMSNENEGNVLLNFTSETKSKWNSSSHNPFLADTDTTDSFPSNRNLAIKQRPFSYKSKNITKVNEPKDGKLFSKTNKENIQNENSNNEQDHRGVEMFNRSNRGSRVFGSNYKYMKNYISTAVSKQQMERKNEGNPLGDKENEGNPLDVSKEQEIQYCKGVLQLQQQSSANKLKQLKQANEQTLQRKEELEKEVLEAYKNISQLEGTEKARSNQQQELTIEIRLAKQRISEAEREAATAIGCTSKLERELLEVERKKQIFWEDLCLAEKRINELETNMRETQKRFLEEAENKNKIMQKTHEIDIELNVCKEENKMLTNELRKKEMENKENLSRVLVTTKEREKYLGQVEELTKTNVTLKEELHCLQIKFDNSQRTVEQCTKRIKEQTVKFDSLISSRLNIEKELKEVHFEYGKERIEKESFANECNNLRKKLIESKHHAQECKEECANLKKENKRLNDKVLYLDLYKQMIDNKTFSVEKYQSKPVNRHTIIPVRYIERYRSNLDNTATYGQRYNQRKNELEEINKKIELLKEEHKETNNKNADIAITKSCLKEQENTEVPQEIPIESNDAPFDFLAGLSVPIFGQTFDAPNYSNLLQEENGDIAMALL